MNKIKTYSQFINESKNTLGYLTNKTQILKFIEKYTSIGKDLDLISIDDSFIVDVDSGIKIWRLPGKSKLPIKFGQVYGDFYMASNDFKTLENSPYYVDGDFECQNNYLTSLEGIPSSIMGDISCFDNPLTSLVFSPKDPGLYENMECDYVYDELGFTTEAHIIALLECDPNWKETMEKLKDYFPDRYEEIIKDKRIRIELGLEDEELTNVYHKVKSIEGGYF